MSVTVCLAPANAVDIRTAEAICGYIALDEASAALTAAEEDHGRRRRQARALAEEHFDTQRVVTRVLERALDGRAKSIA